MLLRGVRLKNYRAFVREVSLPLRPLTLLFGFNSAGKSALLRALPLIAESIRSEKGPLSLDGRAARGSTFRDVRTRWLAGERVGFGLDWADRDESIDIEILNLASTQRQVIETFVLRDMRGPALRFEIELADEKTADITNYTLDGMGGHIGFDGWCPARVDGFEGADVVRRLEAVSGALTRLAGSVHWLGALRAPPAARFLPLVGSTDRIADDGSGAIEVLARESLEPGSAVIEEVSAWFERATKHSLDIRQQAFGDQALFYVELRPLRAPFGIHLADTGEGMAQVLPVFTLGALALTGNLGETPILAIEHPERDLHPRAHEHVADHLVEVAGRATVIVETHSENLLLGVQLAIAGGQIKAEDVLVHWVRATDEGPSFVDTITFDEKARPSAWPPGVFAEDRDLARRLIERRHGFASS
ncbi:MAG: AAA family ATPase [Polyangiaceae bacterium]|nr:AAA family ATPase [Polyangiaceae bacterium]